MNGLHVVLVTHRFWPLVGGAETAMTNLALGLRELGVAVTLVTARHEPQWPADIVYREIPVHRVHVPRFGWGTMRYLISLSRWLRKNRPDIDLVCVSHLGPEAHTAVGALAGTSIPVVVRAEAGDSFPSSAAEQGRRVLPRSLRRCLQARALVATTPHAERCLVELGVEARRIQRIANGVPPQRTRSPARRLAARRALATANEDLRMPENQPLVLGLGQLHADHRWPLAIEAWRRVAANWPHARLWLIGDGPQREELYRRIRDADLYGRVLIPGEFDATDDLLQAADLLISPMSPPKESLAVLEAMAAGLPVVACEGTYPDLFVDGVSGFAVKPRNAAALATTIARALNHPLQGDALAAAALTRIRESRSLTAMATAHLRLFQQLVSSPARAVK